MPGYIGDPNFRRIMGEFGFIRIFNSSRKVGEWGRETCVHFTGIGDDSLEAVWTHRDWL